MTTIALAIVLLAGCKDTARTTTSSAPSVQSAAATPLTPPPVASGDIVPAGDSATLWLLAAENAVSADLNHDGTDDVLSLATIKSDADDQLRLVALDGKATALLWASPRLEPVGEIPRNGRRMIFVGGGKVALTTGWMDLAMFDAATGAPAKGLMLAGVPGDRSCVDPADPTHVFLTLLAGRTDRSREVGGVLLDLAATTAVTTPRPAWCMPIPETPDAAVPKAPNFVPGYAIAAKEASIAIGNADDGRGKKESSGQPVVVRFDPATKQVLWRHEIADAPPTRNYKDSHKIHHVDISPAGVLVVIERTAASQTWEHRVIMLDLKTGEPLFERAVSRHTSGALTTDPHVVRDVLYVPRGDELETWDPKTGELRRTFGSTMGTISGSTLIPPKAK
jgi:hypothetical protein